MSLSLHSSTEYLGGSNRWSRNDKDMVPEKSSIGTDLLEDLLEARLGRDVLATGLASRLDPGLPPLVAEQPVEGLGLQGEKIRNFERLLDTRERNATGTGGYGGGVARGCQQRSFRRTRMASDRVHAKRPGRIRGVARHAREHHIANKKRLSTSTISVNLDAAFSVP